MRHLNWRLASIGAVIAGVVLSGALVTWVGSPEQCPDNFTQAQVDASDCIIGANIGLGLTWLFVVPLVMALAGWLGVVLWRREQADSSENR